MTNVQRLPLVCAALTIVAGYSIAAPAEIFLSLQEGSHTAAANDTGTPGTVQYNGSIGHFTITSLVGSGYPAIGTASDPILDLTADLTTRNGGALTIELSETGFTSTTAAREFLSDIAGGYINASAVMNSYYDVSNAPFGTGSPLAGGLTDNQSVTDLVPPLSGPYSLTEIFTVSVSANSQTNLNGKLSDAASDIPEPGSASLFGAALLAFGVLVAWRATRTAHSSRSVGVTSTT